ncbi:PAS domain S-box protein [Nitrospirota bacterium]
MSIEKSKTTYKIIVALAFGLLGFFANFYPLDVLIPPNKASFVWGLVFPMLISLSWGWRWGLLSATLGLGAQTMWFLWLPKNGWAVFVAIPVYNLWILWHGWCAKNVKKGILSTIYGADIPYRIFFAIMFATVFSWSFRFNPSPWAPQMTLTTAPPAFIHFIQFKVIFEGYMILLLADVLRNFRIVKKVLLLEDKSQGKSEHIISGAVLFGLVFWISSGIAGYMYSTDNLTLADSLILNVTPQEVFTRLFFILICLIAGLLISNYFTKYKESEEKYKDFIQGTDDLVTRVGSDGNLIFINHMAEKMFGIPSEKCLGHSAFQFIHPDDAEVTTSWFNEMISKKEPRGAIENRQVSKDGIVHHVLWNSTFHYDEEGNITFIDSISRDITERKQAEAKVRESEEKYRTLFNSHQIGVAILGINGRIVDVNSAFCEMLGYSEEEIKLKSFSDITHVDGLDENIRLYGELVEGKRKSYTMEKKYVHKQGHIIWGSLSVFGIFDQAGKYVYCLALIRDISTNKEYEVNIETALKEKEVLLKEVHHRVKNNMSVISSLLNMQSTYVKDPEDLEMFRESQGRIKAMALVHEKLYKTESFALINLPEYLTSLAQSIKATFKGDTVIDLRYDIANVNLDIDILIPCGLIINELLTNSFKHAFNGTDKPVIDIRLELIDDKDIKLSIADNGAGLPADFDIDQSTGLGLMLIVSLCTQIKGTLQYKSDNGTVFTLTFPKEIKFARA